MEVSHQSMREQSRKHQRLGAASFQSAFYSISTVFSARISTLFKHNSSQNSQRTLFFCESHIGPCKVSVRSRLCRFRIVNTNGWRVYLVYLDGSSSVYVPRIIVFKKIVKIVLAFYHPHFKNRSRLDNRFRSLQVESFATFASYLPPS